MSLGICLKNWTSSKLTRLFDTASKIRVIFGVSGLKDEKLVTTRKPSYRWQTRATRKHAKIVPIRRAYNVVADNTGLSSFV